MLELIIYLRALSIFVKDDAHYAFLGTTFKGDHEWADEINEPLQGFIDEIKENYFLARDLVVPRGTAINADAAAYVPEKIGDDNTAILKQILKLIDAALYKATEISADTDLFVGDQDLLGRIGVHLQKHKGLINRAIKGVQNANDA